MRTIKKFSEEVDFQVNLLKLIAFLIINNKFENRKEYSFTTETNKST